MEGVWCVICRDRCSFEASVGLSGKKGKERVLAFLILPQWWCLTPNPQTHDTQVFHYLRWSKYIIADPGLLIWGKWLSFRGPTNPLNLSANLSGCHFFLGTEPISLIRSQRDPWPSRCTADNEMSHVIPLAPNNVEQPPETSYFLLLHGLDCNFESIFLGLVSCQKWPSIWVSMSGRGYLPNEVLWKCLRGHCHDFTGDCHTGDVLPW